MGKTRTQEKGAIEDPDHLEEGREESEVSGGGVVQHREAHGEREAAKIWEKRESERKQQSGHGLFEKRCSVALMMGLAKLKIRDKHPLKCLHWMGCCMQNARLCVDTD